MTKRSELECSVICNACESEFELSHNPNNTLNNPLYCPFCGENIEDDYPRQEDWEE